MKSFLFCLFPALACAFSSVSQTFRGTTTSLNMAPRYDKQSQRWIPSSVEEGPEGGYDIWGSLLRQGPGPFFNRVFKGDDYDQAVLKLMAGDKLDRMQGQAEMDAYLRNPNDWAYNRMQGYKVDYLTIKKKQVALTLVWSAIVLTLVGRGIYCVETGDNFWAILGMTSKAAWCEADNSCLLDV